MELRIQQIRVKIQEDTILKGVDLTVGSGEFVSLLGKSGCGKTTLLKSIAGLVDIDGGKICFDDKEIQNLPPEKRGAVIVFQDLRLFPHMTVEQNIAFSLNIKKVPAQEQKEIISALLKEVQLPGFEKRRIKEMSGGQMQRVALARALAAMPEVLLLDEPFSGLDENLRFEMGRLVRKIQQAHGITTIMVTHDKEEALKMSDRVVLMDKGEILQCDTPERIFNEPANRKVADYFGMVNYLPGRVTDGVFESEFGGWTVNGLQDGAYEVVARPTALEICKEGQNGRKMQVAGKTFMGEYTLLQLKEVGCQIVLQVLSNEIADRKINIGDRIKVTLKNTQHYLLEM